MFYTNVQRFGNTILHRYIKDNGERVNERVKYKPTLYLASEEETGWKTIKGVNVKPTIFDDIQTARQFAQDFRQIRPDVVHGITDFDLNFIHETYADDEIKFDFNMIKTFFCDIEVDVDPEKDGFPNPLKAEFPINSITVYDSNKKKYYVFSTVVDEWKSKKFKNSLYFGANTEKELITAFVHFWERDHPDILTGWNVEGFDVPYLINRISKLFGEEFTKRLSPWNKISSRDGINSFGQDVTFYSIAGIEILDYLDLYKKFTIKNQESYKLGFIAEVELGETKVEYEGNLYQFARTDPEQFIEYNLIDVALLVKLEEKLNLLFLCTTVAYMMKVNFTDALGTVRPWTSKVSYELLKEQKVIDAYHRTEKIEYGGGYVKAPLVGKYKWVVSYDFTSLYPWLMISFNISPETKLLPHEIQDWMFEFYNRNIVDILKEGKLPEEFVAKLIEHDVCITGNGMYYHRSYEGIVPKLVLKVFNSRKAKKKEMLALKSEKEKAKDPAEIARLEMLIRAADVMQNSLKVAANSLYGGLGNIHFPLYDPDNAAAITLTGQPAIQYMADGMSKYVNRLSGVERDCVIAIDTDSAYVDISDLIKKVGISDIATPENVTTVTKFADSKMKDESIRLADQFHYFTNARIKGLDFKREKVINGGVWVAKKRYFCRVYDSEGVRYAEPDLAITGLETNRSSTPKFVRDKLTESFDVIIDKDEQDIQEFVAVFEDEFTKTNFEQIAFPRSVNDIEKYEDRNSIYSKGCPLAVRAALMYNHLLDKHGLDKKYQKIRSGNKIKYVYLKPMNPTRENVIGYIDKLPPEFGLEPYIDYSLMFEKTFKEPLQNVLNPLGWSTEKKSSLDSFF